MIRADALRPSGNASVQDLAGDTARDLAPLQRGPNAPPLLLKTQTLLHSQRDHACVCIAKDKNPRAAQLAS